MSTPDRGELIVYRTEDGQAEVQLQTLDGSVWLNQGEMAELFDTTKRRDHLRPPSYPPSYPPSQRTAGGGPGRDEPRGNAGRSEPFGPQILP